MSGPVHITLAVPTPFAVDPVRLVAWLVEQGYSEIPGGTGALYRYFKRDNQFVDVPLHAEFRDYPRCLRQAVVTVAGHEQMEPATLAALLAPPVEGPALQWAHASADTRAPVLALPDAEAENHRDWAKEERAAGRTENALHEDGRAMGLEAAAAVLREAIK